MALWECLICFDPIQDLAKNNYPVILNPCGHGSMCNDCIKKIMKKECPVCKKEIISVIPNIDLAKTYSIDISLTDHVNEVAKIPDKRKYVSPFYHTLHNIFPDLEFVSVPDLVIDNDSFEIT